MATNPAAPRRPIVAALLGLVQPGLGHVYAAQSRIERIETAPAVSSYPAAIATSTASPGARVQFRGDRRQIDCRFQASERHPVIDRSDTAVYLPSVDSALASRTWTGPATSRSMHSTTKLQESSGC